VQGKTVLEPGWNDVQATVGKVELPVKTEGRGLVGSGFTENWTKQGYICIGIKLLNFI